MTGMLAGEFITYAPGRWVADAACGTEPPEKFFPAKGEITAHAKLVCRRCPVIDACRDYALNAPEKLFGVWGGMSEEDRAKLRKANRPSTPKPPKVYAGGSCGTAAGYRAHYRAGQIPCADCRRAAARRRADFRAKAKERKRNEL